MRPRYEDPIDTVKDMVEKNITVFEHWMRYASLKDSLLELNVPEYTIIAENMVSTGGDTVTEGWQTFKDWMVYYVGELGTHAVIRGAVDYVMNGHISSKGWWKSEETIPGRNSYAGFPTSRKWLLNEVIFYFYIPKISIFLLILGIWSFSTKITTGKS